jgi:hypothetical protein
LVPVVQIDWVFYISVGPEEKSAFLILHGCAFFTKLQMHFSEPTKSL